MLAKHQVACLLASFAAAIHLRGDITAAEEYCKEGDHYITCTDFPGIYDIASFICLAVTDYEGCTTCLDSEVKNLKDSCKNKYGDL